ncbi:GNAT family N-acetyltransferase [Aestuariimicrobium soli]|uniref:GNAT family N-acetyltransferase n=1 Tax=Aestuariimicrobium soli TaxID=2035834 RepID=UPI003EB7A73A
MTTRPMTPRPMTPGPVPDPPPAVALVGPHVTLEPLGPDSSSEVMDELVAAIGRPETFAAGWGGGPAAWTDDPAALAALLAGYLPGLRSSGLTYLVRWDGRCVGTTSVGEFEPAKERCHLGWTAYAPQAWGTVVNPEAKLLLLGHLFDHGWGRVRIQADSINERSRRAIAGIGATFEGITRRDQRRADGSWRDAAVFSVIVDEWPAVRSRLRARVDGWTGPSPHGGPSLG